MLLLAGILVGGLCAWFAIKIGFYETWAMLFNIVVAIFTALFLARPIVNFLPEETVNIPCCEALVLLIVAVGSFLILHGITYILFTSQFNVPFPKIFDVLFAGLLGFLGGFIVLSFAALIIFITPLGKYAAINKESVKNNMKSACWLLDGIHSIVSGSENEPDSSVVIEQILSKSQPNTQNINIQQEDSDKPAQPDGS
ncbi:MAG: CvpA family protein [Sedimentisphaerales bacterium]|nr:CvpA family protein [Sedimentisphaerales bacterium]